MLLKNIVFFSSGRLSNRLSNWRGLLCSGM